MSKMTGNDGILAEIGPQKVSIGYCHQGNKNYTLFRNVEPNDIEENIERIANELNEDEEDPVNFPSVPVDMDALATLIENGADHVERNAAPLQRFIFSFFQG